MNERRTLATAFENSPTVAEFIKSGVPANDEEPNSTDGVSSSPDSTAENHVAASSPKAVVDPLELDTELPPRRKNRRRSQNKNKQDDSLSPPSVLRTHAKARIQKSIRFLPHLIVELDEYVELLKRTNPSEELSLQTVMNEALEMWLTANRRRRN